MKEMFTKAVLLEMVQRLQLSILDWPASCNSAKLREMMTPVYSP